MIVVSEWVNLDLLKKEARDESIRYTEEGGEYISEELFRELCADGRKSYKNDVEGNKEKPLKLPNVAAKWIEKYYFL